MNIQDGFVVTNKVIWAQGAGEFAGGVAVCEIK